MQELSVPPPARQPRYAMIGALAPALVLLALIVVLILFRLAAAPQADSGTAVPINPQIEARWGVRITQVGVTADGGLLDLRYTVIDPDRAEAMMNDLATVPVIVAQDGSTQAKLQRAMSHKHDLQAGRSYYILYVNPKGVFRPGSAASVVIGDMRLEPVIVR